MYQVDTKHGFTLDVIEDLIAQPSTASTILLVCSTRDEFLEQLQGAVRTWRPQRQHEDEIPASQEDPGVDPVEEEDDNNIHHPLLTPTLRLLAVTRRVKLVFCPNINTLRAYLSVFVPDPDSSTTPPNLLVLNLLASHQGTSEFTLQGLSRTFATLISAAHRSRLHVRLVECKDVYDLEDPNRGAALWRAEVPLLSGSIKLGGAGASWAGRSVAVRKVAERWFEFDD